MKTERRVKEDNEEEVNPRGIRERKQQQNETKREDM